jgi:hypothetical protein
MHFASGARTATATINSINVARTRSSHHAKSHTFTRVNHAGGAHLNTRMVRSLPPTIQRMANHWSHDSSVRRAGVIIALRVHTLFESHHMNCVCVCKVRGFGQSWTTLSNHDDMGSVRVRCVTFVLGVTDRNDHISSKSSQPVVVHTFI